MSASEIARALGGGKRSGEWWRCRCPVHNSTGVTLALRDGEFGIIAKCWAGCDRHDLFAELRRRGLIGIGDGRSARPILPCVRDAAGAVRRTAIAQRLWSAARDARGTPAAAYLAGRSIDLAIPSVLRWLPSLRRPDGSRGPAMVARIDSLDGELIGVSRTWLDRGHDGTWRRRDRAMLGHATGGAVRLARAAETMMIGEGVETCLAAMQATGTPAWAALSTSGLVALALPAIVRSVIILADHDANGAGERAARAAAACWLSEGRRVRIALPPDQGTDFADLLIGGPVSHGGRLCHAAA